MREDLFENEIARRLEQGDGLEFTQANFARAVGFPEKDGELEAFLVLLVESKRARKIRSAICSECDQPMGPADTDYSTCPVCEFDLEGEGLAPDIEVFFRLEGDNSRDIRWMIVIHGMNSRAPWQEEFSWQMANRLKYSAPILIYKYGWATVDVLATFLQRHQAIKLGNRIRIAIEQARESGRHDRPDIIAHSFGTRLFSMILEDPAFEGLSFGRVITAGSIVRPDFDWTSLIKGSRVEAVLNHVAEKDGAVPFAQFAIPGTGPGGRKGYRSSIVLNVKVNRWGHSDFFKLEYMRELIAEGGLWHSFLTHPLADFKPDGHFQPDKPWKPANVIIRGLSRSACYVLLGVAGPFSWLRRKFDP